MFEFNNIRKVDSIELHYFQYINNEKDVEICDSEDKADFIGVYAHYEEGGLDILVDCYYKEQALSIAWLLATNFGVVVSDYIHKKTKKIAIKEVHYVEVDIDKTLEDVYEMLNNNDFLLDENSFDRWDLEEVNK